MLTFMNKYRDEAYALLRIMAGFMFSLHGAQKLLGVLGGNTVEPFTQIWFAGLIELAGGLCIMLGAFTKVAAFIASGEMAVAYFQVHWRLQLSEQFFPIINRGELAALYCFLFLYIAAQGPGKWSLNKS